MNAVSRHGHVRKDEKSKMAVNCEEQLRVDRNVR